MDFATSFQLNGKTVVLTRAQNQQAEARKIFEEMGAKVLELPALVIGPPDDWTPLDNALKDLENFHWIIFSSINGVKAVEQRLNLLGRTLALRPAGLKIAAVGQKTSDYLEQLNSKPDFVPPKFVADSLIENFPVPGYGLRMLLPRVQTGGRTLMLKAFVQAGVRVTEVPAYESKCPSNIPEDTVEALRREEVDAIAFSSSKTVLHTAELMKKYFGDNWIFKFLKVKIISIGPQTSITCKKYFKRLDREAHPHDLTGLVNACVDSLKQ